VAVPVRQVADLVEWANSKSCEYWKADRSCGHDGCLQAQRAVDILSALVTVSGTTWSLDEEDIDFSC